MKKLSLLFFLTLALLLGCEKETVLHDPSENPQETETRNAIPRRFKGKAVMHTVARLGSEGRCAAIHPAFLTIILEGHGPFTHLGQTRMDVSQCADVTGAVQNPLAFTDSETIFTAANGDELYATGEGALVPTGVNGEFDIIGELTFNGGSGRFEFAYGSCRLSGKAVFAHFPPLPGDPPADVTNRFSGFIYY